MLEVEHRVHVHDSCVICYMDRSFGDCDRTRDKLIGRCASSGRDLIRL